MAEKKIFCPVDGSLLVEMGDHGIVDYDGEWEAQTTKYECEDGKHTIFVAESDAITEPETAAFQEAENAIYSALSGAKWNEEWKEVQLPVQEPDVLTLGMPIKSFDDLRDELAQRALTAFKDEVSESAEGEYANVEYEYIHAIEDVDDILEDFEDQLEKLGWAKEPKEPRT